MASQCQKCFCTAAASSSFRAAPRYNAANPVRGVNQKKAAVCPQLQKPAFAAQHLMLSKAPAQRLIQHRRQLSTAPGGEEQHEYTPAFFIKPYGVYQQHWGHSNTRDHHVPHGMQQQRTEGWRATDKERQLRTSEEATPDAPPWQVLERSYIPGKLCVSESTKDGFTDRTTVNSQGAAGVAASAKSRPTGLARNTGDCKEGGDVSTEAATSASTTQINCESSTAASGIMSARVVKGVLITEKCPSNRLACGHSSLRIPAEPHDSSCQRCDSSNRRSCSRSTENEIYFGLEILIARMHALAWGSLGIMRKGKEPTYFATIEKARGFSCEQVERYLRGLDNNYPSLLGAQQRDRFFEGLSPQGPLTKGSDVVHLLQRLRNVGKRWLLKMSEGLSLSTGAIACLPSVATTEQETQRFARCPLRLHPHHPCAFGISVFTGCCRAPVTRIRTASHRVTLDMGVSTNYWDLRVKCDPDAGRFEQPSIPFFAPCAVHGDRSLQFPTVSCSSHSGSTCTLQIAHTRAQQGWQEGDSIVKSVHGNGEHFDLSSNHADVSPMLSLDQVHFPELGGSRIFTLLPCIKSSKDQPIRAAGGLLFENSGVFLAFTSAMPEYGKAARACTAAPNSACGVEAPPVRAFTVATDDFTDAVARVCELSRVLKAIPSKCTRLRDRVTSLSEDTVGHRATTKTQMQERDSSFQSARHPGKGADAVDSTTARSRISASSVPGQPEHGIVESSCELRTQEREVKGEQQESVHHLNGNLAKNQKQEDRSSVQVHHWLCEAPGQETQRIRALAFLLKAQLLKRSPFSERTRGIVFCSCQQETALLSCHPLLSSFVKPLHEGHSRELGSLTIQAFREGLFPVLLSTDSAIAELALPPVELIVHYAPPRTSETYERRVRCAEARSTYGSSQTDERGGVTARKRNEGSAASVAGGSKKHAYAVRNSDQYALSSAATNKQGMLCQIEDFTFPTAEDGSPLSYKCQNLSVLMVNRNNLQHQALARHLARVLRVDFAVVALPQAEDMDLLHVDEIEERLLTHAALRLGEPLHRVAELQVQLHGPRLLAAAFTLLLQKEHRVTWRSTLSGQFSSIPLLFQDPSNQVLRSKEDMLHLLIAALLPSVHKNTDASGAKICPKTGIQISYNGADGDYFSMSTTNTEGRTTANNRQACIRSRSTTPECFSERLFASGVRRIQCSSRGYVVDLSACAARRILESEEVKKSGVKVTYVTALHMLLNGPEKLKRRLTTPTKGRLMLRQQRVSRTSSRRADM